jgi:glyceraldehyde-3-phosphate dehydrogenase (NAD(P))
VADIPVIYAAHLRSERGPLFSPLSPAAVVAGQSCVRIALPDVIALGRIVPAIGSLAKVERLFANVIVRAGHATERSAGSVDALEPLPEDADMTRQMTEAFGKRVLCFRINRVRAPYSHSHLHTLKLDLDQRLCRQDVLDALSRAPRVMIGAAADGFATTADIQEFFRNGSRTRCDRPEVFVWEESILVGGRSVCLMLDVCQEATSVLDTIDAIRLRQVRVSDSDGARHQTDVSLHVGQLWEASVGNCLAGNK